VRRIAWHHPQAARLKGKAAVTIAVAGGGGGGAPACLASFDRILGPIGLEHVDAIACRRQNLQAKLPTLEHAGKALGEGRLTAAP
jgi:hypothetical protein